MTSEDVVFSFGPERLTGDDAPGKPMVRRYWISLDSVEAVDKYTVRFKTTYEDPIFLQRLDVADHFQGCLSRSRKL